jgi:hypothetical protein
MMGDTPFKQSKNITDLTRNLDNIFKEILSPLLYGSLIKGIKLKNGENIKVEHKLGRPINGFIVVGKDADANVWEHSKSNQIHLNLTANSDVNIDIWVF